MGAGGGVPGGVLDGTAGSVPGGGVGIDTDILYYPREVRDWVDGYRAAGTNARYEEITSVYGHDAFLIEFEQVADMRFAERAVREDPPSL